MISGQDKLLNIINSLSRDSFPRSALFVGKRGCGKHSIIKYISENILNFPIIDITEHISDEYIDTIYRSSLPNIYIVDISKMTEKSQNILLKFVEEPLKNAYIFILAENKNVVIKTVLNRCVVFEFAEYNKIFLKSFLPDDIENKDLIVNILDTPGKLKTTDVLQVAAIHNLCETIANKISIASFPNTLTIVDKINYKDNYDKFDFDIFMDSLNLSLFNNYLSSNNKLILNMYLFTVRQREKLIDQRINKQIFMQNLLTGLWKLSRGI